jgi:hypothetical protein
MTQAFKLLLTSSRCHLLLPANGLSLRGSFVGRLKGDVHFSVHFASTKISTGNVLS